MVFQGTKLGDIFLGHWMSISLVTEATPDGRPLLHFSSPNWVRVDSFGGALGKMDFQPGDTLFFLQSFSPKMEGHSVPRKQEGCEGAPVISPLDA